MVSLAEKKTLRLSLKTKSFEMTKAGIINEVYIEITPYWIERLFDICSNTDSSERICEYLKNKKSINERELEFYFITFKKKFSTNTITLGYPKLCDTERFLKLEHKGIEIREGNPEWGAEQGKLYFVIKHGAILE